jgi:hypothetical protein
MYARRTASSRTSRRRRSWSIFGGVAACGLAGAFLAVLRTSGSTDAGVTLLGGLVVVGLAAGLFHAIISPVTDSVAGGRGMSGGFEGGSIGGGDLGAGGGDCGG